MDKLHTIAILSSEADTNIELSLLKIKLLIEALWPKSIFIIDPELKATILIVLSEKPNITY